MVHLKQQRDKVALKTKMHTWIESLDIQQESEERLGETPLEREKQQFAQHNKKMKLKANLLTQAEFLVNRHEISKRRKQLRKIAR